MTDFDPKNISEVLSEKTGLGISCQVDSRFPNHIEFFFSDIPRPNTFFFDLDFGWQTFKLTGRPSAFSRDLLYAMRQKGLDDSSAFIRIFKTIGISKMRNSLKINGEIVDINSTSLWTKELSSFEWIIEPELGRFAGKEQAEKNQIITDTLLRCIGAIVSLIPTNGRTRTEGQQITRTVETYERDELLRLDCLKFYGYACQVCGFDFEKEYGTEGKGFIEVHHIERLADRRLSETNPITDLIPLCANCHRVAHLRTPPYAPDEIIKFIQNKKAKS
jgi:5-methylcytosine-specific restriction protein A